MKKNDQRLWTMLRLNNETAFLRHKRPQTSCTPRENVLEKGRGVKWVAMTFLSGYDRTVISQFTTERILENFP